MFLRVIVNPRAKQNRLLQMPDGILQVKIKAPAQEGKANEELVKFLAALFALPKSAVTIVSGHRAPFKKIEVNAHEEYVKEKLLKWMQENGSGK